MASAADYRIKKLEKGPLQRFKNQNLLLKKFGEVGLQVYKSTTGKRSTEELRKDLGIDADMFGKIISYMKDTQMIDLEPAEGASDQRLDGASQEETQTAVQPEQEVSETQEEVSEEESLAEGPPLRTRKPKPEPKKKVGVPEPKSMTTESEIQPEPFQEQVPGSTDAYSTPSSTKKKIVRPGSETPSEPPPESGLGLGPESGSSNDEIQPIDLELRGEKETPKKKKPQATDDYGQSIDLGPEPGAESGSSENRSEGQSEEYGNQASQEPPPEDLSPEEGAPEAETSSEEGSPEEAPSDEISPLDQGLDLGAPGIAPSSMSSVEKIIFDRYGELGLKIYALIDGARTAEEIMRETGVSESKLVEILDFMDEQGIIKLDYPKQQPPPLQSQSQPFSSPPPGQQQGRGGGSMPPLAPMTPGAPSPQYPSPYQSQSGGALPPLAPPRDQPGFVPMAEGGQAIDEAGPVPSPLDLPIKTPLDLVKGVQMRAKIMLKYGDKGGKVMELIDGKNDVIDIALKMDLSLPTISEMMRFLMENGLVIMKPLLRGDVKKKYGDDGYAVYKRYGKEGLMLYELIGKDLTIKQMADKVTTDKVKVVEMFLFIHQVLGIELSIDKDVLAKQLGL